MYSYFLFTPKLSFIPKKKKDTNLFTYILRTSKWPNHAPLPQTFMEVRQFPCTTLRSHNIYRFPAQQILESPFSIHYGYHIKSTNPNTFHLIKWQIKLPHAYPVLHASLIILTESAVMTNASAQAKCPICGFGSEEKVIQIHKSMSCLFELYKNFKLNERYLRHPRYKLLEYFQSL